MQTHPSFLQQLEDILIAFLTPVMGALGIWIVFWLRSFSFKVDRLKESTDSAAAKAQEAAELGAQNQQVIIKQTNGITDRFQKRLDDHTRALIDAKNAEIHAKDAAIEALKKANGP